MNFNLRTLLHLIESNADSTFLLGQGLTYSQIADLFSLATKENYIIHDGNVFSVTERGKIFLTDKTISEKYGNVGTWVAPDERSRIPQTEVSDIFLPKLSESKLLAN